MMNILEEAIIYATVMHQGKLRKLENSPYILHSMEVAQILSTMTDDMEIITAGILHDIVEDTDGTLAEIEKRFGKRVADIVASDSENDYLEEERSATWKRRKEESLLVLKNSHDIGVRMLWLADKLANIRSLAGNYSEYGEAIWQNFNEDDPELQRWYFQTVAETVELSLNKTGAFKEFIKHINFIWPGTFDSEKTRYKKYKEVSIDGCRLLGRGAKGEVYRYNDELIIKVFNENNTYHDVEREIALSRKSFILGIPTAISFGIVSVGNRYGAMYELVKSETISGSIAKAPRRAAAYAKVMAELAHTIHTTEVTPDYGFPDVLPRLTAYIEGGVAYENEALAEKCRKLLETLPSSNTLVHGDFHTGNVFLQHGEPLLIDMDRISMGHPIVDISGIYYFYVILGEEDPSVVEKFMGFSCQTARHFCHSFMKYYFETEDEDRLREVTEKLSFLCYLRMVHRLCKKEVTEESKVIINRYMNRIADLAEKLDSLDF